MPDPLKRDEPLTKERIMDAARAALAPFDEAEARITHRIMETRARGYIVPQFDYRALEANRLDRERVAKVFGDMLVRLPPEPIFIADPAMIAAHMREGK